MKNRQRKLFLELLETRQMLTVYAHSAADDFAADFSGGLPQNNPNGDWTYLASDDTTTSLIASDGTNPINTYGIGAGWVQAGGFPSYAIGGALSLPTGTIAGHGPQKVIWTAPADVDMGAVQLSGELTQLLGQSARQMQLSIFKNGNAAPFLLVAADSINQSTSILPPSIVAMDPGDTLTIVVDGSGPQGNGISTFSAWDIDILEVDPEIDADFNGDFVVDQGADLPIWQANFGTTVGATQSTGDADNDGDVDGADLLIWQRQFGNEILSGNEMAVPPYDPSAVIVQTSGVTLPNGSLLDISGTQTQGLQEAFDFAADEGWGVFVLPGTYTLDAGLDVVERQGASFRLQDVTMNFGAGVTDFGLRFDSAIILDWYWDGGALNAPNALDGVRFDARNFHPLDGCLGLTPPAIADNRYIFEASITAATNEVTMDTSTRTINDNYFHFQGLGENDLNIIGSGFADSNTFLSARPDSAIPWDLFSTAGRVTVNVPNGPIGTVATVYKPDGSLVNTAGTTTSGLQEAFDHAAANDLDVLVFGQGIRNSEINGGLPACGNTNQGLYNLSTTLDVGALDGETYRIFNVTFNYTGSGTAMAFGDVENADFELTGQIGAVNGATGVLIQPQTTALTNSVIRVEHMPIINDDPGSIAVRIDPSLQTIENSEFYFTEILGGETGLQVDNPSASTFFRNNVLSTVHTHDYKTFAVRLGTTSNNSSNIHTNTLDVHIDTDGGPSTTGLQVWGDNNTIAFGSRGAGLAGSAARLETASNDNVVAYFGVNRPLVDMGTNNSYVPGLLLAASSSAAADTTPFANQVQLTSLPFRIDTEVRQEYLASESEIIEPYFSVESVRPSLDGAVREISVRDIAIVDLYEDEQFFQEDFEDFELDAPAASV
ncbi:MAG: hypothetical protein CMJ72_13560 [Planctomycetaceae bacterium]|nr:hypothetical protein [Planctomycetaceae bacterium]